MPDRLRRTLVCSKKFVKLVEKNYHKNPYHNFKHAFSVMTGTAVLLRNGAHHFCDHVDAFALLIAALVHDICELLLSCSCCIGLGVRRLLSIVSSLDILPVLSAAQDSTAVNTMCPLASFYFLADHKKAFFLLLYRTPRPQQRVLHQVQARPRHPLQRSGGPRELARLNALQNPCDGRL